MEWEWSGDGVRMEWGWSRDGVGNGILETFKNKSLH